MNAWVLELNSWDDYYDALVDYCSTEFCRYVDYSYYIGSVGTDLDIVTMLLNKGLSAQEGLDKFLMAAIRGNRYSAELLLEHGKPYRQRADTPDYENYLLRKNPIIDLFVQRGAVVNYDILFANYTHACDDFAYTRICGQLIDLTHHYGLDASKYGDWKNIRALHWEQIHDSISGVEAEKMYLKFCSVYLRYCA